MFFMWKIKKYKYKKFIQIIKKSGYQQQHPLPGPNRLSHLGEEEMRIHAHRNFNYKDYFRNVLFNIMEFIIQ